MFNLIIFSSIIVAGALIYYHWEAMLVSYLSTRKTTLPFNTLEEMYRNTEIRLALIPSTSFEDQFKYSPDPFWRKIYEERLEPSLKEYSDYPDHMFDMVHFIKDDFETALYDAYFVIR